MRHAWYMLHDTCMAHVYNYNRHACYLHVVATFLLSGVAGVGDDDI